jgi:hypothetical protein
LRWKRRISFQTACLQVYSHSVQYKIINYKLKTINLKRMGLIKIFSGEEILAVTLKERLEESDINVVIRNNNQANVLPSIQSAKAVELFIQEIDFGKANPVIEEFRLSI